PSCGKAKRTPGLTWRLSLWAAAWCPARAGKSLCFDSCAKPDLLSGTFPSAPLVHNPPVHCTWVCTRVHKKVGNPPIAVGSRHGKCPPEGQIMQIGVYGSGYLGTVISACLADFGVPVTCCHSDSSRMVEMAQGSIPFFERNLKEVIRRNVRCGRLAYSTDIEAFARKVGVIFLAEDSPEHLGDIAV